MKKKKYGEKMKKIAFGIISIFMIVLIIGLINSQELVLQMNPDYGNDTFIQQDRTTINSGNITNFKISSEIGKSERVVIFFNLSQIPFNAVIQNASFDIYLSSGSGENFNLTLYRMTRGWTEAGATWGEYDGVNSWTTEGGDYSSLDYGSIIIDNTISWKSWNNENFTRLIQELVNGTYINFGMILISKESQEGNNEKIFASKENTNSAIRPRMSINYILETNPPYFSDFIENPMNDSGYVSGNVYKFNMSVNDNTGVNRVWIEFNGINYTENISNLSNVYSFNKVNLASGTYSYKWWANDSYGNLNNSGLRYYSISKSSGDIKLYLNGNENNLKIEYPEQYNVTAKTLYGSILLYRDGSDITANNGNYITPPRSAGYYNITAISSGDENHSSVSLTRWLNVTLDVIAPVLNINSPRNGVNYGYSSNLPLTYSVNEEDIESCWYNLNNGNNISLNNCQNTTFSVVANGSYVLYLYARDLAGNINSVGSSFYVSSSMNGSRVAGGTINDDKLKPNIKLSVISEVITYAGDRKTLSLKISNIGKMFLNNCRLKTSGEISSWVYSSEISGIAPGQNKEFIFDLNVPEGIEAKDYSGNIGINCDEIEKLQNLKIMILNGFNSINIKDIVKEGNGLKISYILHKKNLIGENAVVDIWLMNEDDQEITRINDIVPLTQDEIERNVFMEIPEDLSGIHSVYFAFASDTSDYVKQSIVIGKGSTTGFAILDNHTNRFIGYGIFLLIIGVGVFFMVRKFWGIEKRVKKKIKVFYDDSKEKKHHPEKKSERVQEKANIYHKKRDEDEKFDFFK